MIKDYSHETGYESLLADFKRYNKQTPKWITQSLPVTSETQFEQWYEHEILKKNVVGNEQLTLAKAIANSSIF